jgi:PPOX class probable F420-dependent enzyme
VSSKQQASAGGQHAAPSSLSPRALRLIRSARVAHLATADSSGQPHVVPICFAFDGKYFYSPIDEKPKRSAPAKLKRLRNIKANPQVSLVIDHYEEDWSKLAYVLITGTARIIRRGQRQRRAIKLLRKKYPQYRRMALDTRPMIALVARRITVWLAQ